MVVAGGFTSLRERVTAPLRSSMASGATSLGLFTRWWRDRHEVVAAA